MLEVDQEYIKLVKSHLLQEAKISQIKIGKKVGINFYQFLDEQSSIAKKLITDDSIVFALSGHKAETKVNYMSCEKTIKANV